MAPLTTDRPLPPDPVCTRCSKPITPRTAAQMAGRPVHIRCLARATQLDSIEQQDAASRTRERAGALVERASELVSRARAHPWVCPVCEHPLKDGGGLLFQGEALVHALCWQAPGPGRETPADP